MCWCSEWREVQSSCPTRYISALPIVPRMFPWCFHIPPQTEQYCWLVFLISNIGNRCVAAYRCVSWSCLAGCYFGTELSSVNTPGTCLLNSWIMQNRMMYHILGHLMNSWLPSYHLTTKLILWIPEWLSLNSKLIKLFQVIELGSKWPPWSEKLLEGHIMTV